MTISQALRKIKKLKGKMAELTARASASVSYEAGKKPAFDFKATRQEVATVRGELIQLEAAVAKANATTTVTMTDKAMTIAEAVRTLQELKSEMAWLPHLTLRSGTERRVVGGRYGEDPYGDASHRASRPEAVEVVYTSDLSEVDRAKELDELRERFDRINDAVETANHKTEVDLGKSAAA